MDLVGNHPFGGLHARFKSTSWTGNQSGEATRPGLWGRVGSAKLCDATVGREGGVEDFVLFSNLQRSGGFGPQLL